MLKKQSKKTKKLIICLVFVVATGTIINANHSIEKVNSKQQLLVEEVLAFDIEETLELTNSVEFGNIDVINPDCFIMADIGSTVLGILSELSYENEHEVFLILYDICVEQN